MNTKIITQCLFATVCCMNATTVIGVQDVCPTQCIDNMDEWKDRITHMLSTSSHVCVTAGTMTTNVFAIDPNNENNENNVVGYLEVGPDSVEWPICTVAIPEILWSRTVYLKDNYSLDPCKAYSEDVAQSLAESLNIPIYYGFNYCSE
jgi:hypothetical protein